MEWEVEKAFHDSLFTLKQEKNRISLSTWAALCQYMDLITLFEYRYSSLFENKNQVLHKCSLLLCVYKQLYITWWRAPAGRIMASPRNWITVQVFTPYSSRSLWRSFLFTYQLWSRIGSCSGRTSKPCSFAICKHRTNHLSLSKEAEPFAAKF